MKTYEELEIEMNKLVDDVFINGVFLSTLRKGEYSMAAIRHFAQQYSFYSRHFPRVLGAAISAMPPLDTWWIALADNLWDEAGRGRPGRSHEQLYKTFLLSVEPDVKLDEQGVVKAEMSSAVATAVQTFIDFFHHAAPLEAMAAVGLGSEMFAGQVMGAIADGLRHPNYNKSPLNLVFWDAHADEHEPHHYALCKNILVNYKNPSELDTMLRVGKEIAKSEARMYAQLHEQMVRC